MPRQTSLRPTPATYLTVHTTASATHIPHSFITTIPNATLPINHPLPLPLPLPSPAPTPLTAAPEDEAAAPPELVPLGLPVMLMLAPAPLPEGDALLDVQFVNGQGPLCVERVG